MIVGPGNKAVRRIVAADQTVGPDWLVTSGLNPGDKVIVEGLSKIREGKPIQPVPARSRPAPAGRNGSDSSAAGR
jgi:membrane fusion protein (multidrug efflux system)